MANNLLSDITEGLRVGQSVCQMMGILSTIDAKANDVAISYFGQKPFLSKPKKLLKEHPQDVSKVVDKLNSIRAFLLEKNSRLFIQFGTHDFVAKI